MVLRKLAMNLLNLLTLGGVLTIAGCAYLVWDTILFLAPYVLSAIAAVVLVGFFFAIRLAYNYYLVQLAEQRSKVVIANNKAVMNSETVKQVQMGIIHAETIDNNGQHSKFKSLIKSGRQALEEITLLPEPEEEETVMYFSEIAKKALRSRGAGRFIVFGGMDSGKTTLAKHLVDLAVKEIAENRGGQVFIIDPHAPEVVWGNNVKVIGHGMDYESIASFLDYVVQDVKERYSAGCGDDSQPLPEPYKPNIIICEEWAGIIAELQANKRWTKVHNRTFYQDARKAGWGFFLIAHEHTVNALGLQGMSNLLNGVEYFITLKKDSLHDEHNAIIGRSFKDKEPFELITPGPYRGRTHYSETQRINEVNKADKYLIFSGEAETEESDKVVITGEVEDNAAEAETDKPKYHPDFVNAAIDSFLEENPEVFPTKGQVASAVGVRNGKNYGKVISVYSNRLNEWKA